MTGWGISCVNIGLFCFSACLFPCEIRRLLVAVSAQRPAIIIKYKCGLKFQDVEHLSCVTEIRLCNYLEQAWTMSASEDICIVELIHTTPLLLSVSLLLFSFLPSFCQLLPGEAVPSTHAIVHCFWLPAHQRCRQLKHFFPSLSSFSPNARLVVTFPSRFTAITTAARAFDPCHLPETSHFSISPESCPASFCCKSHARSCSCEPMHLRCSDWDS